MGGVEDDGFQSTDPQKTRSRQCRCWSTSLISLQSIAGHCCTKVTHNGGHQKGRDTVPLAVHWVHAQQRPLNLSMRLGWPRLEISHKAVQWKPLTSNSHVFSCVVMHFRDDSVSFVNGLFHYFRSRRIVSTRKAAPPPSVLSENLDTATIYCMRFYC